MADETRISYVRALYDYRADDHVCLSFVEGDVIQVIAQLESGWWDGLLHGIRGYFPSNYCTEVSSAEDDREDDHEKHADQRPLLDSLHDKHGRSGARQRGYRDSVSSFEPFDVQDKPLGRRSRDWQHWGAPSAVRRCTCCSFSWSQLLSLLPILVLAFFGAVHLLRVIWSNEGLFWDSVEEDFMPDWGSAGSEGESIAHYPTDATRDVIPIPCHSHNDYWRRIPFWQAIHYGCTGVEADVWLKHDELYVGHSTSSLTRNRTFTKMYVNPLLELLDKQNPQTEFGNTTGHGVFDEDPYQTLVLLVDFKTDGRELWPYVQEQISPLRQKGYLSYWDGTETHQKPVTVVATGNAPFDLVVANQTYRDIFFDAPLDKLTSNATSDPSSGGQGSTGIEDATPEDFNGSTSYYASVSLNQAVGSTHRGKFSETQLEIIRAQIQVAQIQGLKARYWDTPGWPVSLRNHVWQVLIEEGVDYLNVDDLRSASKVDWRRRSHELI